MVSGKTELRRAECAILKRHFAPKGLLNLLREMILIFCQKNQNHRSAPFLTTRSCQQIIYFELGAFAIGWMYGFHGFAPIGTDFFLNLYQSVRIREIRTCILSQNHRA
ncbi:MAG: hypothetical protein RL329_1256 [Bacteroidota bacterium]|jgi:hypothetical protein